MSKVISPYYSRNNYLLPISLLPNQIDSNYKDSLLKNLRDSYEGKCNKDSYIIRIDEISEFGNSNIPTKNITSSVEFSELKVKCYICIPHKYDNILMKISNIDESMINLVNGSIKGFCRKTRMSDKFTINKKSLQVFYNEKEINVDDIVVVEIINVSCISKQSNLDVICNIVDMANKNQIEIFNKESSLNKSDIVNDDKFI